ncbi:MAG TPA: YCF48-related protein, partial [Rhizobacter sp.]|nr:YCF48-related protein [Rhizobacter sp.]
MRRLTPLVLGVLLGGAALAAPPSFVDPLDQPALASGLAAKGPMGALSMAGDRLVAAGARGHVLFSGDAGQTWSQAKVPVSSDLVAVTFADAQHGWAVGHDSVIIATTDGGKTWVRQLDGRQSADPKQGDRGAENPLLDVWFADARQGWAVGAFGQIRHTQDGGATWSELP